jgi:cobalt-zinc-cadmium efflux system protein
MSHTHSHAHVDVSRKLVIATIATGLFVVVEAGVGFSSNSLALVGDALHNFTDALALVIAFIAVRFERRPPTMSKSYGYHRAGVLAAFINSATLAAFTIYIFFEAFTRLRRPETLNSGAMLYTAVAALALNAIITLSLRHDGEHDLNIRGAVLHMFGDAISSAGIIVAAILIRTTGKVFWDSGVSILIGVGILWSSWDVLREAVNLLLEGTPAGVDPDEVTRAIAAIDGVFGVHHLHIWALARSRPALSCHLMVGDVPVRTTATLIEQVNAMLARDFHIAHTTVQFEFANCEADDPYCVPYSGEQFAASGEREKRERR